MLLSPVALALLPKEVALLPFVLASTPNAKDLVPFAFALSPMAIAWLPLITCEETPRAMAPFVLAFAVRPIATEPTPEELALEP